MTTTKPYAPASDIEDRQRVGELVTDLLGSLGYRLGEIEKLEITPGTITVEKFLMDDEPIAAEALTDHLVGVAGRISVRIQHPFKVLR